MLAATFQNSVARATWCPRFVHPSLFWNVLAFLLISSASEFGSGSKDFNFLHRQGFILRHFWESILK